ncbi:MAG: hypothetical protein WCK49_00225 [Myxococcaceae bacterium]
MKLYSKFLALSLICLSCLGQNKPISLTERQKNLVRWAYRAINEVMKTTPLPAVSPQGQPPDWKWIPVLLEDLASDSAMLELIINTKNDIYKPCHFYQPCYFQKSIGDLIQEIAVKARKDKDYRIALLKGYQWEDCSKAYFGALDPRSYFQCGMPPLDWSLIKLKFSDFKSDFDSLLDNLFKKGLPKKKASELTVEEMDQHLLFIELFVKLAPRLQELISLPCEIYLEKSLQEVDVDELRSVLEELNRLLKGTLKAAEPRNQRT